MGQTKQVPTCTNALIYNLKYLLIINKMIVYITLYEIDRRGRLILIEKIEGRYRYLIIVVPEFENEYDHIF